ncbi:hypothetical protein D3H65_04305 [Paraflavitalea soli]|uniref:Outer membrane protein beta-barrel domain-containing protein n=1 Tax=Paraflavitalea soli TaxID=2315862 RepID=A0A3B7MFY2_9BACT|nr:carboxypeptidase regulatory-like domain-containing protein [Paraflavitalea soli]AXY73244.1 hypothetical protein D3H65_04305 [Paraflavitalea soli]
MKYKFRLSAFSILLLFINTVVLSQSKDSVATGTIRGSVKDSVLNYYLQAATVAVYRVDNKALVAYTLTNSIGEFRIAGLELKQPFLVKISFIGYETFTRIISISHEQQILDIGVIIVSKTDKLLDEVTVTAPPVRMNGDTLEFSASAFHLDKNAVAEDLLKKLPGIIIWGDGTITVNGRPINKLLVDGKPFFGGDTKVATQNIPTTAISKVQVYQEYIDPLNPYDSITAINLKLKKDYRAAYFGSVSAGAGTDKKYETAINNSVFTPRDQIAIVGQANNVNKLGNDINTLLRSGTFKGTGAHVAYQPDFNMRGINKQVSGGYLFTHDLIPAYNQFQQNRIASNSFVNKTQNNTIKQSQTISFIGKDSSLLQNSSDSTQLDVVQFNTSVGYNKKNDTDSFTLKALYRHKSLDTKNSISSESFTSQQLLNTSSQIDDNNTLEHGLSFIGAYDHHGFKNTSIRKLLNWSVLYSCSFDKTNTDRLYKVDFTDLAVAGGNLYYNRKYANKTSILRQEVDLRLGDFATWLFGESRILSRFNILFENNLKWNIENQTNIVSDGDKTSGEFIRNSYLSNTSHYKALNEKAGLKIGRVFTNMLANRYQKDMSVYLDARVQLYNERFSSAHSFQYFNNSYFSFIPSFNLGYSNYQYGEYLNRYNLNFDVTRSYPSPEQRVALVDSSQVYQIRLGNALLSPQTNYVSSIRFGHDGYRTKNSFNYGLAITGGVTKNYLTDSIVIDQSGRYIFHTVNYNDYRYIKINAQLNKAFLLGNHQFQLSIAAFLERSRRPSYLGYQNANNAAINISTITIQSDSLSLYYTYKDIFALNIAQSVSYYHSRQHGFLSGNFKNKELLTKIGAGLNMFKKASLNSNVNYNYFGLSDGLVNKYIIWNASVSYRFLKSNDIELKLSALDILNQNKGIVNFGNSFFLTHQNVNLQHQYFMATITYYPRKFGSKRTDH